MIRRLNAKGVPVGGTSAGAAILPEHMIAYGSKGGTPKAGMVSLSPGLGLTNRFIIDQHFRERDRLGRLLSALSYNPFAVGLGIDENTSAMIDPNNIIHVVGTGTVTVVDVTDVAHTSMPDASEGDALCITNVKLHVLPEGAKFDLRSHEAIPRVRNKTYEKARVRKMSQLFHISRCSRQVSVRYRSRAFRLVQVGRDE